jgi:hypothetical protein
MLAALLPVKTLLPALPVPLIAAVPARSKFSTLAGRVVVVEAERVSVMVVVTVAVPPKIALVGLINLSVKVSLASLMASLRMGIEIV